MITPTAEQKRQPLVLGRLGSSILIRPVAQSLIITPKAPSLTTPLKLPSLLPQVRPVVLQIPPQAPLAPLPGMNPEFLADLKAQILLVAGTSNQPCLFGTRCNNAFCRDHHNGLREMDDNPEHIICRFSRSCARESCFYLHPAGREIEEDPDSGPCEKGVDCDTLLCFAKHPFNRKFFMSLAACDCGKPGHLAKQCPTGTLQCEGCGKRGHLEIRCPTRFVCHHCKQPGHTQRSCPERAGPTVLASGFPLMWAGMKRDDLVAKISSELEPFGELEAPPELADDASYAVATFISVESARNAVEKLFRNPFKVEFRGENHPPHDRSCCVFVGNLTHDCTDEEVQSLLEKVGIVKEIRVQRDKNKGVKKGYVFCDYHDTFTAEAAVQVLHDSEFKGRKIRVMAASHYASLAKEEKAEGKPPKRHRNGYGKDKDRTVFIGNIAHGATEAQLKEVMSLAGEVIELRLDPKGFAFCDFREASSVEKAIKEVTGMELEGRELRVAKPGDNKKEGKGPDEVVSIVHVDELFMPRRPEVAPHPLNREVWMDPLPERSELVEFGEVEEYFPLEDPNTGDVLERGYVKFLEPEMAAKCVASGRAEWSESERILGSQASEDPSPYEESLIAVILGKGGQNINAVMKELGAVALNVRGEGLGTQKKYKTNSKRLHFFCVSTADIVPKVHPALEKMMAGVHDKYIDGLEKTKAKKRKQDEKPPGSWVPPPPAPPAWMPPPMPCYMPWLPPEFGAAPSSAPPSCAPHLVHSTGGDRPRPSSKDDVMRSSRIERSDDFGRSRSPMASMDEGRRRRRKRRRRERDGGGSEDSDM